jgi:hypothetical protein
MPALKDLSKSVSVGVASIKELIKGDMLYESHLTDMERVKRLRKPMGIRDSAGLVEVGRSKSVGLVYAVSASGQIIYSIMIRSSLTAGLAGSSSNVSATRRAWPRSSGTAMVSHRVPRKSGPSVSSDFERAPSLSMIV